MISSAFRHKVRIHITTYKRECQETATMEEKHDKKGCKSKKFVCSICLNPQSEKCNDDIYKTNNKYCPICQKTCDYCQNNKRDKEPTNRQPVMDHSAKNVQTSDSNVAQGLNLLNEVLTVFQKKRVDKETGKLAGYRDVGVSTDAKRKDPSKLTVRSFQYSIDTTKRHEIGKFTVVCSCQPVFIKKSQYSIDLIKHKSSSIPQMKLEELKHSLKEKTRSKDAIEEVNRMFATVRRSSKAQDKDSNRPMVRNGPRVLPVVKKLVREEPRNVNVESMDRVSCKCCQTHMSSGDSCVKPECCHETEYDNSNNKCVYMMCCHYQNKSKMQTGGNMMICEHCRTLKENNHCEHDFIDDCY